MMKEEAVTRALDYVRTAALDVGPIVDVRFLDIRHLDEMAEKCPPDLVETYHSVRESFRNQWIVAFKNPEAPGQVSSPETTCVCVFENGEITIS